MAREIVQPLTGFEEQLRPVAAPVNTYVRPPEPAPSNLHQLADALVNFSHDIGGLVKSRQADADGKDKYRAQLAAEKANGLGYAEAVKQGIIPSYSSPTFQKYYKQSQGAILGRRLSYGMMDNYRQSGLANEQDPTKLDAWLGDQIKGVGLPDDEDVLQGAMPYIGQSTDSLYAQYNKDRDAGFYNGTVNTAVAGSSMDIDQYEDTFPGQTAGQEDLDVLWGSLIKTRQTALDAGVRADDFDKNLMQTIAAKAIEHGDPALLGLLANKMPGSEYKLSDTLDGQKLITGTLDSIEAMQRSRDAQQAAAQSQADKEAKDKITSFTLDQLAQDPGAEFDEGFIKQAEKYDPEYRTHLRQWQSTMGSTPEDDQAIVGIQEQILNGAGVEAIMQGVANGDIHDPNTITSLHALVNSTGADGGMKNVLTNPAVKDSLDWIDRNLTDDTLGGFGTPGLSQAGIAAKSDYLQSMYAFVKANPQADFAAVSTEAQKTLKRIQSGMDPAIIQQNSGSQGANAYRRPEAVQQQLDGAGGQVEPEAPLGQPAEANPLVGSMPTAQEAEQQRKAQPVADPQMDPWRGDKPPSLQQLSKEDQQKVNTLSQQLNQPTSRILQMLFDKRDSFVSAPKTVGDKEDPSTSKNYITPSAPKPPQMVERGNIDLTQRPIVNNPDGTYSTVATIGIEDGGKEVVIPTVIPDDKGGWHKVSDAEAEDYYHETGQHFGKFSSVKAADDYAEKLHNDQAKEYGDKVTNDLIDTRPDKLSSDGASLVDQKAYKLEPGVDPTDFVMPATSAGSQYIKAHLAEVQAYPTGDVLEATAAAQNGGSPYKVATAWLGQHVDERDPQSAKALSAFFKKAGLDANPANTPWCAAFANAVLVEAGYKGTGKLNARSFLDYGTPVSKPQIGDIVVFKRGNSSWEGHVGFIAGVNADGTIDVLGGNQSTKDSHGQGVTVNVKTYATDNVLGYRRPVSLPA